MRSPSDGERAAASGLWNQYGVGATLILEALRQHDLEWIRVADPVAGRVDDFQIAKSACLDGYQVKWEQYPGYITLNEIIQDKKEAPSLISQLVDGWKRLKAQHPHRRIKVHLVTNAIASKSTSLLPDTNNPPTPYHFAAFIEQAWKPAQKSGEIDYQGQWGIVWQMIKTSSTLSEEEFSGFFQDCAFDFNTPLPITDEDHQDIAHLLFTTVASPERIVELDRAELLNRLKWTNRYTYRSVHEFEVPRFYRPITSTVKKLEELLDRYSGGYLCVLGPPGSGKSTLLTRTLRSLPVRLIRYYAYIPGAHGAIDYRGESTNFFHDVTLRLEEAGFGYSKQRPVGSDRVGLIKRFHDQLQELGQDYSNSARKTIILIDGLDHIAREQKTDRSLLTDLPYPDQIPNGVYIVLGSQTTDIEDFPHAVSYELSQNDRCIEMGRLSPADIESIVLDKLPRLEEDGRHRLIELSQGHPLALIYIIKQLESASNDQERVAILAAATPYGGDIEKYYWSHWQKIQRDVKIIRVLGLLARVRGAISMRWVDQWIDISVMDNLKQLKIYFDIDSAERWTFFHNSFRLFLQTRTAQYSIGLTVPEQEEKWHSELASLYSKSSTPWCWEALHHLYHANDHAGVLELSTTTWFRTQVEKLRPLEAIIVDVRFAVRSAGIQQDSLALIRFTLILAALDQQNFILEDFNIAELLLDINSIPQALERIRDGNTLRVKQEDALYLSGRLASMGLVREGTRLFELSEPYELLSGQLDSKQSMRFGDTLDVLDTWAEIAIHFRSPDDVVAAIMRIKAEVGPYSERSQENATAKLQGRLTFKAAITCAERGRWTDWEVYFQWITNNHPDVVFDVLLHSARASRDEWPEKADSLLQMILNTYQPAVLEEVDLSIIQDQINVAELVLGLGKDEKIAIEWIKSLPVLPLQGRTVPSDDQLHWIRIRLFRLMYSLGERQEPRELLIQSENSTTWSVHIDSNRKTAMKQIALAEITLASLWARGRRGEKLNASGYLREIQWIMDLLVSLRRSHNIYLDVREIYPIIVDLLVHAAWKQEESVVDVLIQELRNRWERGEWSLSLRRTAILAVNEIGRKRQAAELLIQIGRELRGNSPRKRADEHWNQANAWVKLGDLAAAQSELCKMVIGARGLLDDHDYQSEVWVRWMERANQIESNNSKYRILTMLKRLVSVQDEASGIDDAMKELIRATFKFSPINATQLIHYLQNERLLSHRESLSSLLCVALEESNTSIELVLQIFCCLIIPLTKPPRAELVKQFLISSTDHLGKDKTISIVRHLVQRIHAEAIETDRQDWLQQIADTLRQIDISLAEAKILPSELREEDNYRNQSRLYLIGGEEILFPDICGSIRSVTELSDLMDREDVDRSRFYYWDTVAIIIVDYLTSIDELLSLSKIIETRLMSGHVAKVLTHISEKAYEMDHRDIALMLARKAVEYSPSIGWIRSMDGGTRLNAIRVLAKISPEEGKATAVRLYAEDIGSGSLQSYLQVLFQFDDIIPLLFDQVPVLKIWEVLEEYLDDLYRSTQIEQPHQLELNLLEITGEESNKNPNQGIANALALYFDHPSYFVASQAVRAATAVLISNPAENGMPQALIGAINRSEEATIRVLAVLEATIINNDPKLLLPFEEILLELTHSANFLIRVDSSKLVARLKNTDHIVPRFNRDIPPIYTFELPNLAVHRTENIRQGIETPMILDDPARLLRPLDIEARAIAEAAHVDENAVLYQAARLLREFACQHSWLSCSTNISEKQLNSFLDDMGLRVAFYKPHIEPAKRALYYVMVDLWDAGLLDVTSAQQIIRGLFSYDTRLIIVKPQSRPKWLAAIGGISEDERVSSIPPGWLERVEDGLTYLQLYDDQGRVVMSEYSHFRYLGSKPQLEEDRLSCIGTILEDSAIEDDDLPFYKMFKRPIQFYPEIQPPHGHIIVKNDRYGIELSSANWIALNPMIARELGWRLASDGLFRWIDGNNNIAVESIWWQDGGLHRFDFHESCSVAEGWIVVATPKAYQKIAEMFVDMNRTGLVRRRIKHEIRYKKSLLPLP
jgi:hypothetical protein